MNDLKHIVNKAIGLAEKYKYALIVLAAGLVLLCLPISDSGDPSAADSPQAEVQPQQELEEKLQQALEQITGAGRVQVVLTIKESQQRVLASDETETQSKTVTIQSGSGTETVTVKSIGPVYQGALVVCDGADSPSVRLDVVNSVSALTGLGADRISVVKMRSN